MSVLTMLFDLRRFVKIALLAIFCIANQMKKLEQAALTISRNTINLTTAVFEDVHGKTYQIHTDFITNWKVGSSIACRTVA